VKLLALSKADRETNGDVVLSTGSGWFYPRHHFPTYCKLLWSDNSTHSGYVKPVWTVEWVAEVLELSALSVCLSPLEGLLGASVNTARQRQTPSCRAEPRVIKFVHSQCTALCSSWTSVIDPVRDELTPTLNQHKKRPSGVFRRFFSPITVDFGAYDVKMA